MSFDDLTDDIFSNPIIIKGLILSGIIHEIWEGAIDKFETLDNPDAETHYFISKAYDKLNKKAEASKHLGLALKMGYQPTMDANDAHRKLVGKVQISDGSWKKAISSLEGINKPDGETYYFLAIAYSNIDQTEKARSSLINAKEKGHTEAKKLLAKIGW
jgi:lipopolysaccharide biosynthesis regulator YciM